MVETSPVDYVVKNLISALSAVNMVECETSQPHTNFDRGKELIAYFSDKTSPIYSVAGQICKQQYEKIKLLERNYPAKSTTAPIVDLLNAFCQFESENNGHGKNK